MDLCLECKGCKAECQTGVDMAKLKYEFLDQYHKVNGISLRARIFANINRLSRINARFAPFSNWASGNVLGKVFLHRILGIHASRSLPPLVRRTFPHWFKSRRKNPPPGRPGAQNTKTVVLFNDTFMNYNYPQVGIAAVELLERAGFNVVLANSVCCGRPMLSKGLVDRAKINARQIVDQLYPYAVEGIPIVGCEPSCLLTFRDEYPDLLQDDKSRVLAGQSYLIDEFLHELDSKGDLSVEFDDVKRNILFHGHCHQKTLVGTRHSVAALQLPTGHVVEEVRSGCCGMAGSFGYEKEHYKVSMDIGRQQLFPAVESKDEQWEIAVMGVSCRQQIEHGTGRKARHLVEILRDALR